MKNKSKHEQFEVDMSVVEEEIQSFMASKKQRTEFYSYASIEEEFPLHTEEDHIAIWKKRVARAEQKFEKDGKLFISKASKIFLDQTEATGFLASVRKQNNITNAEGLEASVVVASDSLAKFVKTQTRELPGMSSRDIPEEAIDVDWCVNNVTTAVGRALTQMFSVRTLSRDLRSKEQRQEELDNEWFIDKAMGFSVSSYGAFFS
jgi:hypothetical protein